MSERIPPSIDGALVEPKYTCGTPGLYEVEMHDQIVALDRERNLERRVRARAIVEVRHGHALGLFAVVQHARLVLDPRPLECRLVAVDVEAFDVLPGCFEQAARHLGH